MGAAEFSGGVGKAGDVARTRRNIAGQKSGEPEKKRANGAIQKKHLASPISTGTLSPHVENGARVTRDTIGTSVPVTRDTKGQNVPVTRDAIVQESRAKLAALRQVFMGDVVGGDWLARWWSRLSLNDCRQIMAMCGGDDSIESARRSWRELPESVRLEIVEAGRHWMRVWEGMQWA